MASSIWRSLSGVAGAISACSGFLRGSVTSICGGMCHSQTTQELQRKFISDSEEKRCTPGSRLRRALNTPSSKVQSRLALSPGSSNPLGAHTYVWHAVFCKSIIFSVYVTAMPALEIAQHGS